MSSSPPPRSQRGTGHYTQLVWADSDELGCGMVYFEVSPRYPVFLVSRV